MSLAVFNRRTLLNGRWYEPGMPVPDGVLSFQRFKQMVSLRRIVMEDDTPVSRELLERAYPLQVAAEVRQQQVNDLFSSASPDASDEAETFTCRVEGCGRSLPSEQARDAHEERMHDERS